VAHSFLGFRWFLSNASKDSRPPQKIIQIFMSGDLVRPPILSVKTAHLWHASLDLSAPNLRRLEASLDADERKRAEQFLFERGRKRFVASRGLLRQILGCYCGVEPRDIHFNYGSRGKPFLAEKFGGRIQFNVAHSDGFGIFAVTLDGKIGVDLEHIIPIVEAGQIADRFFSDQEKAVINSLSGRKKSELFFKIWTAKEAYLKARGEGLTYPLNKVDVLTALRGYPCSLKVEGNVAEYTHWSLRQLRTAAGFVGALVVEESKHHSFCNDVNHELSAFACSEEQGIFEESTEGFSVTSNLLESLPCREVRCVL